MNTVTNEMLTQLSEPLPASQISWRVGATTKDKKKGQALPYIDARVVQSTLDRIVGPGNWKNEFHASPIGAGLICRLAIKVGDEWVYREDASNWDAGSTSEQRQNGESIALKGAYSDSFKRSAVMWGIGRYLYSYDPQWVELDEYKKMKATPKLPAYMLPSSSDAPAKAANTSNRPAPAAPIPAPSQAMVHADEPAAQEDDSSHNEGTVEAPVSYGSESYDTPAEAPAQTPAQAPVSTPAASTPAAAAPSASSNGASDSEIPSGLTEKQRKNVDSLLDKIQKGIPRLDAVLKYVTGSAGTEALGPDAKKYILSVISKKSVETNMNLEVPAE